MIDVLSFIGDLSPRMIPLSMFVRLPGQPWAATGVQRSLLPMVNLWARRGTVGQAAARPVRVVVTPPPFDQHLRFQQRVVHISIQQLIS